MRYRSSILLILFLLLAGCAADAPAVAEQTLTPGALPLLATPTAPPPTASLLRPQLPAAPGAYPLPHQPALTPVPDITELLIARAPNADGLTWGQLWLILLDQHGAFLGEQPISLYCADPCQIERFTINSWNQLAYTTSDGQGGAELHIAHIEDSSDQVVLDSEAIAPARMGNIALAPTTGNVIVELIRGDGQLVERDQFSLWYLSVTHPPQQLTEWSYTSARFFWVGDEHIVTNEGNALSYIAVASGQGIHLGEGRVADFSSASGRLLVWQEPTDSDMGSAYDQPSAFGIMALAQEVPELVHTFRMPAQQSVLAPDGVQVAQRSGGNLMLVTPDGQRQQLTNYTPGSKGAAVAPGMAEEVVSDVQWTANGQGLLFIAGLPGRHDTYKLQHLNLADGSIQTLAENVGHMFDVAR